MSDDEGEIQTECDGGDACGAIEVQNLPLAGGPWPDPARLRTEQLRMELETVYAALGLGLTSSPQRVVKLAADLWDLLGKPEKASVLRSDAPTPLALFDLCRGVHRYSDRPHDPLWLIIAQNAQEGRRLAGTTTAAAEPWTSPPATVESVTEMIRRATNPEGPRVKVGIVDPWNMGGPQVIPVPPAYFDPKEPGGEPAITLTVGKSRFKSSAPAPSVPLEVADINRAEGEPQELAADFTSGPPSLALRPNAFGCVVPDLLTRTLEHEAAVSGAAESEPEPVRTATEAMQRLGESVVSMDRGRALGFWYTNHRGLRAWRWVIPDRYWTGGTSHYPDVFRGLFLDAFDLDRNANRSFLVDRMEGPFQTAEPLDLPVGPTVDEQERLAELRAEGHTDHCASAQVAAGQECGCNFQAEPEPEPEDEPPIEVGQVWIAKDSESPRWLDSQGQEVGIDLQRNDRWRRVVVKQGPNAGGLYGVVPQDEPDYLPSFVTAASLREAMRLRVGGLTGGPADTLLPADIIPEPAPVRDRLVGAVHVSPDGQALSVDPSRVEFREPRPSEVLARLLDDEDATREENAEVVKAMGHDLAAIEGRLNEQIHQAIDRSTWPAEGSRWRWSSNDAVPRVSVQHLPDGTGWRLLADDGMMGEPETGPISDGWEPVDEESEDGCYRCEGEERFEGDICDGCGSVADGQGGTVTPTGPYAEHLAIVESWRVADPPPTVPSGEVLSVEPAAVLNASVDGVTRAFSVHPSVLNTLSPSDPEGW